MPLKRLNATKTETFSPTNTQKFAYTQNYVFNPYCLPLSSSNKSESAETRTRIPSIFLAPFAPFAVLNFELKRRPKLLEVGMYRNSPF